MSSKVWVVPVRHGEDREMVGQKALRLFQAAGLHELVGQDELVAVKMHFGERKNTGYIKPEHITPILEVIKGRKGKPFLTDTNTLYRGQRQNSVDHLNQAYEHGFGPERVGVPVIIADGLLSKNYSEVSVAGKHFRQVRIANDILHSDVLLTFSHVTGHIATGFGAAIKNLGMGGASRGGKQMQHSDVKPKVSAQKCKACGLCLQWCPVEAIEIVDGAARIDEEKCYGCGECTATCRFGAIDINWKGNLVALQEKMAEYAWGVVKDKLGKVGFMNFLIHVTKECDCMGKAQPPVVGDVGILAARDPVAIDQASIDLLTQVAGKNLFQELWPKIDCQVQLDHAAALGLGSREYELVWCE